MELLIVVIGFIAVGIGGFYVVTFVIKLWTGCNNSEAVTKLHNIMNGKIQYAFNNDEGFIEEVWDNVKNVIGDKRYCQLERLSMTAIKQPLTVFGERSGLPYIIVSIPYEDEHEKRILENVLSNLVVEYLRIYGFSNQIITSWKVRHDLDMPYILIRYARTREEKRKLDILLNNRRLKYGTSNKEITDENEEEDLE